MSVPIIALIVGIDQWLNKDLPKLKGAVNDAKLMRRVLQERFGATDENVKILINEDATRQGIIDAFRTHLTDRAKKWKNSNTNEPSPAFVFVYAGHGSRATDPTGTQPDGKDETIVPFDSRVGDVYDVKDWEIGGWLDELTQYTDNVTVIMDCCNSGSGTRDIDEPGTARVCEPDERVQPVGRPKASLPSKTDEEEATTRSVEDGDTESAAAPASLDRYVALAACRSYEVAKEYRVKVAESQREDKGSYKQGAFTWLLAKELMRLPANEKITYQELFERVRYQVHRMYRSQMPQCEGDRNRLLFGGARVVRDPMVTVLQSDEKGIWIDVGSAHGYAVGAKFNVYTSNTRSVNDTTEPFATMTITYTQAVRSLCVSDDDTPIPELSRALVIGSASGLAANVVCIEIEDADTRSEIADRLAESDLSSYVTITDDKETSDFRIGLTKDEDSVTIRDKTGRLLVEPTSASDLSGFAADMSGLCRYHNTLKLENGSPDSVLKGKISVEIHRIDDDPAAMTKPEGAGEDARSVMGILPIEKTDEGVPIVPIGQRITIGVTNHSQEPLYCEVISFGYDYAIVPLFTIFNSGSIKRIMPGGTLWLAREKGDQPLEFQWPSDPNAKKNFVEGNEFLKVIATQDEPDYSVLRQYGLRIPYKKEEGTRSTSSSELDQLFSQAMAGSRALGFGPPKKVKHDWTTADMEYLIVRPDDERTQSIPAGKSTDLDQFDMTVSTPKTFSCEIKVMTEEETTRCTEAGVAARPSGLVWDTDTMVPVTVTTRSSTAPAGVAIEIRADGPDLETLSPDNPLSLKLNSADNEEGTLMAIAWEGGAAFPVAVSDNNELEISWLPESRPEPVDPDEEASRSLLRTIKLYLFRSVKIKSPELGLFHARFVPTERVDTDPLRTHERTVATSAGEFRFRSSTAEPLNPGQRVALLVHGFASDGKTILTHLSSLIGPQLEKYDHVMTFDYESFNTPISENGKALADALVATGFGSDDGIDLDLFAPSMGAMVARSMVEQHGGGEYVNRCFLAGPPSAGSSAVQAKMAVRLLGTMIVNAACPVVVRNFLNAGIRKIESDAVALNDLLPDSAFLKSLASAPKPDSTQYLVLAGNFDPTRIANPWYQICASVADSALNLLFADNHDLFTATSGITSIRGQNIEIASVGCHHFQYLSDPECGKKLAQWLEA